MRDFAGNPVGMRVTPNAPYTWVMRITWAALGAVLLAIAGCSQSLVPVGGPAAPLGGTGGPDAALARVPPHTVSVPLGLRSRAELDVVSGATTITVSAARLGGALLTASTPPDSGVAPELVDGRAVQVFLDQTGQPGPAALRITLNSAVRWQLVFSGGSSQTAVDLTAARLVSADFTAGTSLISMRLPDPSGTATIVLAGGASQLNLSVPAGVPARLRLDGGASAVTLGGRSYTGIAGGTVLTDPGWASAANRYDIDAPAGVSTVFVTSRPQ
jgi:hypothetical protein